MIRGAWLRRTLRVPAVTRSRSARRISKLIALLKENVHPADDPELHQFRTTDPKSKKKIQADEKDWEGGTERGREGREEMRRKEAELGCREAMKELARASDQHPGVSEQP